VNKAQLVLMQRRLAQAKPTQVDPRIWVTDTGDGRGGGVNGGFRAGKRKRGNSLIKRKPRASTVVTTYVMRDDLGQKLGEVKTLTYKRQ